MNRKTQRIFLLGIGILLLAGIIYRAQATEIDFNQNWKFSLEAGNDAAKEKYDDTNWRELNLPHDWSVEFPFDSVNGEGATGYLPGGIGWYRKHFKLIPDSEQKVYVLFDGVYNNSEYWLNGKKLGERPYGYVPFYFDLTPYLDKHGDNVFAVRVDRSRIVDSRWYPGSGIYRNVKLVQTHKLHIPIWGTFITTPEVDNERAVVNIELTLRNDMKQEESLIVSTEIFDSKGNSVELTSSGVHGIRPGTSQLTQQIEISNPSLWNLDDPNRYKAVTRVFHNGQEIHQASTFFGIRTFRFDADNGFYLNGQNMKIKGVCLHHSAGMVGAAVPKAVWKRRLQLLKDMGCNAIRIAHNPGSEEFLDLCDEMGFLVQDEFFDEWYYPKDKRLNCWERHDDYDSRGYAEHFGEWAQRDLENVMLAHRNHPSIIQWSIGNEIEWTYPSNRFATGFFDNMSWEGNYFWSPPPYTPEQIKTEYARISDRKHPVEEVAHTLARWTRAIDTSRPVVANCILPSASFVTGYADALDIVGFSYRRVMYDYAKEYYPDKVIMGMENLPQWHEWKAVAERPYVSGLFIWTGFDHMGEVTGGWPMKTSPVGLIDQIGFPNTGYHMYRSLWKDDPHIYIYTQLKDSMNYLSSPVGHTLNQNPDAWDELTWYSPIRNEHWNYNTDDEVLIEVISNCEQVELFLNNTTLGVKYLADFPDRKYKWFIPYEAGTLIAKGIKDGQAVSYTLNRGGKPVSLKVSSDRTFLHADGYDAAHITVQLLDAAGNSINHTNRLVEFEIDGNLVNLGVDNGSRSNVQDYKAGKIRTHNGRAMLVVQSGRTKGEAAVRIKSEGLPERTVYLKLY